MVWLVWLGLMAITSSYAMSEDATSEYATSEDATSEEWINSSEPVHINSWAGYDTRGSWLVVDGVLFIWKAFSWVNSGSLPSAIC